MPHQTLIQSRTQQAIERLAEIALRIAAEASGLLARLEFEDGDLKATKRNLQVVDAVRRRVAEMGDDLGAPVIRDALYGEIDTLVAEALADFPQIPSDFRPEIANDLRRVLDGAADEVVKVLNQDAPADVARALRQVLTGALPSDNLVATVARGLQTSLSRAATAIDRGLRQVTENAVRATAEDAELPDGEVFVFVYEGPDDSRTRPYCDVRVGKYLTAKQVSGLDPTERYNCRHQPVPLLRSDAQARGIQPFEG